MADHSPDPTRSMAELLAEFPSARRALFAAFHIGGCQSCAFSEEDPLNTVCEQHDINIEEACEVIAQSHTEELALLISPVQLAEKIQSEESSPILVDARTSEEFDAVPFPEKTIHLKENTLSQLSAQNLEAEIIIFDHSGQSVMEHVSWFRGHGLKQTFALQGGIDQYAKDIDPSIPRYRLELD